MIVLFTPTRKLVWDLIIMILSFALRDKAFDAQGLEDARSVLSLVVWGPTECMEFRWKREKLKTPIFRRIKNGVVSDTEAMTYGDLNDAMGRQSLDAGNEKKWTAKFGRRAAGNAVNGVHRSPPILSMEVMKADSSRRCERRGPRSNDAP